MHSIPPRLLPPDRTPPIRTTDDLLRQWQALMGHLGFGSRSLWLIILDRDGRITPALPRIEDLPVPPDQTLVRRLLSLCTVVLDAEDLAGGSVAVLLSRPGSASVTASDRAWARQLGRHAARLDLAMHPMALATDEAVVLIEEPDRLAA